MKEILKKNLTGEYEIFENKESSFQYECLQCGSCCQKITVTIDPYDVYRLKQALKRSTTEIMQNHLGILQEKDTGWPLAFLRAAFSDRCEFNRNNKCIVWMDRPKVCRMFPIGLASTIALENIPEYTFYLLRRTNICKGFEQSKSQTVSEWLSEAEAESFLREYQKYSQMKYSLLAKYDFNALDQPRIMLLAMVLYDFDALFGFLQEQSKLLTDEAKLTYAMDFFPWLVNEITPDKHGKIHATALSPEFPPEVFFGAISQKLKEIIAR